MVAPIETKGDGRLVVDGVIADFKVMEEPLTITFKDGRIVKTEGPDAEDFDKFVAQFDDTAKNVCEFGIGTNPSCRIMGNGLVLSLIHILLLSWSVLQIGFMISA